MDFVQNNKPLAYAAYNLDEDIRSLSSSGGIFSTLSNYILEQKGVVFGCSLDSNMHARHIAVEKKEDLYKLRGSKYVQSEIGNTYIQCAQYLKQGRMVLFTGTPCQIEGLYGYLEGILNKEKLEQLYTQDLICHGAPSPGVWQNYLDIQREKRKNSEITNVNFRDKSEGWTHYSYLIEFSDGLNIKEKADKSIWSKGFLSNLYLRPSCYECKYKKINRKSDITLADFWGIQNVIPELTDDKGISLVMLHSQKGIELLDNIKDSIYLKKVDFETAIRGNPSMIESAKVDYKKRKVFFAVYPKVCHSKQLEVTIEKYSKKKLSVRIYLWVRRQGGKVLRKVGLKK